VARRKKSDVIEMREDSTLPGFFEAAPNVWVPDGYEPTPYEIQTPIVTTRAEAVAEYLRCQRSLPHFVTRHCWTLHVDDPTTGVPTYRKFPAYPYVLETLAAAQRVDNFHVEKSRQLLMSWMWMAVFLWDILFHEKWGNVAFSTIENLVDDGGESSTPDSLFGKVRTMHTGLAPYLKHDLTFRHMIIQCPSNNSYIRGRAASPKGGRGPAYKRGLMDEAAHMERGAQLYHGLRASVKFGLIMNSSPLGKGNIFATIRFKKNSTFRRISLHWSRHPEHVVGMYCTCGWTCAEAETLEKVQASVIPPHVLFAQHVCLPKADGTSPAHNRNMRSPWYDIATADYTPEQIASEYDISYEKSQRGRVYDVFDMTRHVFEYQDAVGPQRVGETAGQYRERYLRSRLKPGAQVVIGLDWGVSDPTSMALGQVIDDESMEIEWLDEEEATDQGWSYYHTFLTTFWVPIVKHATGLDPMFYGDPSGKARDSSLTSWISNLAVADPPVTVIHHPAGIGSVLEWLEFIRDRMRRGQFAVSMWCTKLIDSFGQYHFPLDKDGNPVPGEHLPVHDQWCHRMDAVRYVYTFRYYNRLANPSGGGVRASEMFAEGLGAKGSDVAPDIF
jgi:hypothetical protein